jgi:hypothetical protein
MAREVAIVGVTGGAASDAVKTRIGDKEAAVVIPKRLFLEACHVMLYGNISNSSRAQDRL